MGFLGHLDRGYGDCLRRTAFYCQTVRARFKFRTILRGCCYSVDVILIGVSLKTYLFDISFKYVTLELGTDISLAKIAAGDIKKLGEENGVSPDELGPARITLPRDTL